MMVVAAYDISADGRRSKVAALLQSWGDRVQRSVYVLDIGPEELADLRVRLSEEIDVDTDSIHLFTQCVRCADAMVCIGQSRRPEKVLYWSA